MGRLRFYAFWIFRFYSSTANFPREAPDLKLSGNLHFSLSQISAGKLRSYAFWKFRSYSSNANFPRETPDLKLSGNLDFSFSQISAGSFDLTFPGNLEIIPLLQKQILFSFRRFDPETPRFQALWKFRSWSFFHKFLWESLDLTFPGSIDIIPF